MIFRLVANHLGAITYTDYDGDDDDYEDDRTEGYEGDNNDGQAGDDTSETAVTVPNANDGQGATDKPLDVDNVPNQEVDEGDQ